MKCCEFFTDSGTLCGLKAVQFVINFMTGECFFTCKKHKFNGGSGFAVLNLRTLVVRGGKTRP